MFIDALMRSIQVAGLQSNWPNWRNKLELESRQLKL